MGDLQLKWSRLGSVESIYVLRNPSIVQIDVQARLKGNLVILVTSDLLIPKPFLSTVCACIPLHVGKLEQVILFVRRTYALNMISSADGA